MSSTTSTSLPLHPIYKPTFAPSGAEFAVWTNLLGRHNGTQQLVTAHANSLRIYAPNEQSELVALCYFDDLAGNIVSLDVIRGVTAADALLIGFAGLPRLSVVRLMQGRCSMVVGSEKMEEEEEERDAATWIYNDGFWQLHASSIIDFTSILVRCSVGSLSPAETEDLVVCVQGEEHDSLMEVGSDGSMRVRRNRLRRQQRVRTAAAILGGGVGIAVFQIHVNNNLSASAVAVEEDEELYTKEPFVLDYKILQELAIQMGSFIGLASTSSTIISDKSDTNNDGKGAGQARKSNVMNDSNICSGFGDILDITFLTGYSSPTIAILHAPRGRTWTGRLSCSAPPLALTALSISVEHKKAVILWSCGACANDARYILSVPHPICGCLIFSPNVVQHIHQGRVLACLALNGFAYSSVPSELLLSSGGQTEANRRKNRSRQQLHSMLAPNPHPLPPLSIQLDGSRAAFVHPSVVLVSDRSGRLYSLEIHCHDVKKRWNVQITLLQLNNKLCSPSSVLIPSALLTSDVTENNTMLNQDKDVLNFRDVGIVFSGSVHGNSSLLEFSLKRRDLRVDQGQRSGVKRELDEYEGRPMLSEKAAGKVILDEDEMLYKGYSVTVSDDESTKVTPGRVPTGGYSNLQMESSNSTSISQLHNFTFSVIDSLSAIGSINYLSEGPCIGAYSFISNDESDEIDVRLLNRDRIFSHGMGSSGGLALLSCVGGSECSDIVGEQDLLGAQSIHFLPNSRLLIATKAEGEEPLILRQNSEMTSVDEVNLHDLCEDNPSASSFFDDPKSTFCVEILGASDLSIEGTVYVFLLVSVDSEYGIVCFVNSTNDLGLSKLKFSSSKTLSSRGFEASSCSFDYESIKEMNFSVVWSDGILSTITFYLGSDGKIVFNETLLEQGSKSDPVVASDILKLPGNYFRSSEGHLKSMEVDKNINVQNLSERDHDYLDLYGITDYDDRTASDNEKGENFTSFDFDYINDTFTPHLVICRESGMLQIFSLKSLDEPVWESEGCGTGIHFLSNQHKQRKGPKSKVIVSEIRLFVAGRNGGGSGIRRLHLAVNNDQGDIHIYSAHNKGSGIFFVRERMGTICRVSSETMKHQKALKRKGLVKDDGSASIFRRQIFSRFDNISGESGLFVSGVRPLWVVAERGRPVALYHKLRFNAPGSLKNLIGFCSDPKSGFFFTLHERLGRVGSQRLSVWAGLDAVFTNDGFLPGGGYFLRKVSMGVTVKRLEYFDHSMAAKGHPVYAMIVSHEIEEDQSDLNDDGLTPEERRVAEEEKEAERTKRQVEADLGGYDIDDNETEDVFDIDKSYGLAPPISKERHEVLLVDANGWKVLDRFLLDDYEQGLSLKTMALTEVQENEGENNGEDLSSFIIVGTGKVNDDGEDSECVGRILLFQVNEGDDDTKITAELSLIYEKDMPLGPVTCLASLDVDNKARLVVGAGQEVTVEQWTGKSLLQVGFFHANMHIQNISLLKGFFLLSDSYDSLHFLVWRESDKSLTLLAKDYEPTAIFASGVMSRGSAIAFICHDERGNIQLLQYAPSDEAARGGNRMVCRSDFYLGAQTVTINSHWCRSSLLCASANVTSSWAALQRQEGFKSYSDENKRFGVHFGTIDGGMGTIVPVSEQVFWRMTALQSIMGNALECHCSLNFRMWRLFRRTSRRGACQSMERRKGILDGSLLFRYSELPLQEQEDFASAIGSTVGLIMDNLLEIECATLIS